MQIEMHRWSALTPTRFESAQDPIPGFLVLPGRSLLLLRDRWLRPIRERRLRFADSPATYRPRLVARARFLLEECKRPCRQLVPAATFTRGAPLDKACFVRRVDDQPPAHLRVTGQLHLEVL